MLVCIYTSNKHISTLDISHVPGTEYSDLRKRGHQSVLLTDPSYYTTNAELEDEYVEVMEMHPLIAKYRQVYADDLEDRLRLRESSLPITLAVSTLLNPMFGLQPTIVGSGLMTGVQYKNAESALLQMMIDVFDANNPNLNSDDSCSVDSRDGILPLIDNGSHRKAQEELAAFYKYKKAKYLPKIKHSGCLELYSDPNRVIRIGDIESKGEDLPSKVNITDYMNKKGRFNILRFFGDHKKLFPTIYIIAQCMASRRVVEVGCERFFSLTGYISAPRRTRLGVRTYERLAILSSNLKRVYVDPNKIKEE